MNMSEPGADMAAPPVNPFEGVPVTEVTGTAFGVPVAQEGDQGAPAAPPSGGDAAGFQGGVPLPQEGAPAAPAAQEPPSPELIAERAAYFEEQARTMQEQLSDYQRQIEEFGTVAPLARHILEDPQLLQQVANYLQGGDSGDGQMGAPPAAATPTPGVTPMRAPTQVQPVAPPERPSPPQRPANFDAFEAQSDPDSESAKYVAAVAEYPLRVAEYQQAVFDQQQAAIAQQQQALEQRRQQEAQAQQMEARVRQLRAKAIHEYGLAPQEADGFLAWAQSDHAQNDLGAWVAAYQNRSQRQPAAPASPNEPGQVPQAPPQQNAGAAYVPGVGYGVPVAQTQRIPAAAAFPQTAAAAPGTPGAASTDPVENIFGAMMQRQRQGATL